MRVRKGLETYVVACRKEGYLAATQQLDSGIGTDEAFEIGLDEAP